MRLITTLVVAIVMVMASTALAEDPAWISVGDNDQPHKPQSALVSSDQNGTIVEFQVGGFWSSDTTDNGNSYQLLSLKDQATTTDIGRAQLPVLRELIAIPNNAEVQVEVLDQREVTLTGFKIYPYQKPLPYGEKRVSLDIDEAFYSRNEIYPSVSAEISKPGIWRDLRLVSLQVNPVRFNPVTGELKVCTAMTVKLTYGGVSTTNAKVPSGRPVHDDYDSMYRRTVLNYETLGLPVKGKTSPSLAAGEGGYDYLIISADEFVTGLAPFVSWKNSIGFSCQVAAMSEVGSTVEDVKDYITQEYYSAGIRYVLLVGDTSHILGYDGYWGYTSMIDHSDYYYMLIEGDDDYPELALGRFSVESMTDLDNIVNKTVKFESDPPLGDWLDNALLIAHLQNAPTGFTGMCEDVRTAEFTASGTYSYVDPEFTLAYGALYEDGGNEATNADITAAINAGQLVVTYFGHGSPFSWGAWNYLGELFSTNDIAGLSNGSMTPVIFSHACATGDVSSPYGPCMGETFTRSSQGAVAFRGSSENDHTGVEAESKIFATIFDDGCFTSLGNALNQVYVESVHDVIELASIRMGILFGDPSLDMFFDREPRSKTLWVNCNTGNDETGDGTEEFPYASIPKGIDIATERHYDTILVESGIYPGAAYQSLTIPYVPKKDYLIIAPASDTSHPVIDGSGFQAGFTVESLAKFKLCGFTLENCRRNNGGGAMLILGAEVVIDNCEFRNCSAGNYPYVGGGGALSIRGGGSYTPATMVVSNSRFIDNYASPASGDGGGAVFAFSSVYATFDSCVFKGNNTFASSSGGGGAVSVKSNAEAIFNACLFQDNSSSDGPYNRGGAVYASSSDVLVFNGCTFDGNQGDVGSVLYESEWGAESVIGFNCNIISNSATGAALYSNNATTIYGIDRNDFWQNTENLGGYLDESDLGVDNIFEDPLFCDPQADMYTLAHMSPCSEENSHCGEQIGAYGVSCYFDTDPSVNQLNVSVEADVSVTFDFNMDETTITENSFKIIGRSVGQYPGSYSYDGQSKTATFQPTGSLVFGDLVSVYLTDAVKTLLNTSLYELSWSFTSAVGAGNGSFDGTLDLASGTNPKSVCAADFDNDGDIDIATANNKANTVTVFLNDGSGQLDDGTAYSVGRLPNAVCAADVDADGDLDLITANSGRLPQFAPSVSVVYGNGDGTFSKSRDDYAAGSAPMSICAADLNNDGYMDVVAANSGDDNVAIYINDGAGAFEPYVTYVTGTKPYSVVAGDMDNDGNIDLVTANYDQNTVAYLPNDGEGVFDSFYPFASGGSRPYSVAAGDFNEDGYLDLATVNYGSANLAVLLNDKSGNPAVLFNSPATTSVGSKPKSVAVADLDADGHLDLVSANSFSDDITLLIGDGLGGFEQDSEYGVGDGPAGIVSGDINGDGSMDIVTANYSSSNISIVMNGCCIGMRGNVDNDPYDVCDEADSDYLLEYLTGGGPAPVCMEEADVDNNDQVDFLDVAYLIDYLFNSGPEPVSCDN